MKLRSRYVSLLVVGMLCMHVIVLGLWAAPQVGARGRADVVVDVSLPSDSTGIPDGTLAVRIFAPASAGDARYADGAPGLIFAPGGTDAGTLRPALSQAEDVIRIVFLFPGGTDPLAGRSSDGIYDHRGANSIAALRDVILYAAGELTDSLGRTIDDVLPVSVLHNNIGLLGGSNGGNIIVTVAAEHGLDLAGHLRYVIQWESPVSSQIATVDLGRVRLDCPPGPQASLLAVNPRYQSYGPLVLGVDYSQLTYDASDPLYPVFFDGTGDGHYTTVVDPGNGCQTPDLNLNGDLELNEDFPLSTFSDGVKQFYSGPVAQALASQNVFGGGWPADVATPPQAIAFWSLREAVRQYPTALTNIPGLEGMVLTSVVDHVQTAPDHPHIHQAFDGWDGNGAWVKINPARHYVLEVNPALSSRTDLPDNVANTAPADWTDASSYAFPDGLDEVYFAAAVHEMADRSHTTSVTPTATATTSTLTPTPTPTPSPTPTLLPTHIYLPLVMKAWRRPWPTPAPTPTPSSTPLTTAIDTHAHLDGKYWESGPGGPSVVTDFDSAAAMALAKMDELGIQKSLVMPPPFSPEMVNSPLMYDCTDLAAVVENNPERFGFLGGGGLLNPMIHAVPSDQVTEQTRQEFEQRATAIAEAGAAGFGEMTALHLSFFDEHPFLETPPDHELFLLLADVAVSYDMPIDLHMEAVVSDMELRPIFSRPQSSGSGNDNFQLETQALLDHFPQPKPPTCQWQKPVKHLTGPTLRNMEVGPFDKTP